MYRRVVLSFLLVCVILLGACIPQGSSSPPATPPTISPTPYATLAPNAQKYLDTALDFVQENFYFQNRVNWKAWRGTANRLAAGATTPEDTYIALRAVIRGLKDPHTVFLTPEEVKNYISTTNSLQLGKSYTFTPPTGEILEGKIAHITVPSCNCNESEATEYADQMQEVIMTLDAGHPCGWVVDVRYNKGGYMPAMLTGLGPLLGEGELMYLVDQDGLAGITIEYQGEFLYYRTKEFTKLAGERSYITESNLPVAILMNSMTASAAEAVVVSFQGRPNVRKFGEATAGATTYPLNLMLEDGAMVRVAAAVFMDRNGLVYGGVIEPDEETPYAADVPPVVIDWLLTQPSCQNNP